MKLRPSVIAVVLGGLALVTPLVAHGGQAQGASDAASATVLIRLIGDVEAEAPADLAPPGQRRFQESNVQIGTGSGFLVTPIGHILTCAHVVVDSTETVVIEGHKVDVKLTVRRVEVVFAPGVTADARPYEAMVIASDPDLDLAVLSIGGTGFPYLDLGDSDALEPGDGVVAYGYPYGRAVEIGRTAVRDSAAATAPSVSQGNVSAFRDDDYGRRRYMQTTAAVSTGSSGGPVVDADGYVAGIVSRMLVGRDTASASVPFAIAVNVAKEFLEARSLDSLLGAVRAFPGSAEEVAGKGLRVAFLHGLSDRSPLRTRVDTASGSANPMVLRIDRVLSPWTLLRLADALTADRAFEAFAATTRPAQRTVEVGGRKVLLGHVTGTLDGGENVRMEYAIADLGAEKLVARYLGPPDRVAFNASVLRASLRSLEGWPLRTGSRGGGPADWAPVGPSRSEPLAGVPMPVGWLVESVGPMSCQGLPAPSEAASASPPGDFALALRAGWLRGAAVGVGQAAAACGGRSGPSGIYERQTEWLGTSFTLVGCFIERGPGELLHLEAIAPVEEAARLRSLFEQWLAQVENRTQLAHNQ